MLRTLRGGRSIRLAGYDYSSDGVYFVTICAFRRAKLFGEIRNAKMIPNPIGALIRTVWYELPKVLPGLATDAFAIMPNHLHGILVLLNKPRACQIPATTNSNQTPALARIVQTFKSLAHARVKRHLRRTAPLWQRNYYGHIVRTGKSLTAVQRYIWENPLRWQFDRENPRSNLPVDLPAPWQV
jgi:putative transposase